jgi:hypothetical protein
MNSAQDQAHAFLSAFEDLLERQLPAAPEMETWIRHIVRETQGEHARRHLHSPEAAFLNAHVLPLLAATIRSDPSCASEANAKRALLNEYHPSMPEISSHTPARTAKHPFTKLLGANAQEIYARWADANNASSLVQSCPDFALREPFRHTCSRVSILQPGTVNWRSASLSRISIKLSFIGVFPMCPKRRRAERPEIMIMPAFRCTTPRPAERSNKHGRTCPFA